MAGQADIDIVIFGATGFTGQLVAEYFQKNYSDGSVTWAMAGRSAEKLAKIRDKMGISSDVELITADSSDPQSMTAMACRAKVVITTVGPYQLYGEELLKACVCHGTHYVDLCGEPAWMRQMIDRYEDEAKSTGAAIVFSCGFDSIPFDLGVFGLQKHVIAKQGKPATRVKGRVRAMQGTFSGGTAASLKATMAAAAQDPAVIGYLTDPFSLAGGFTGPQQPSGNDVHYDDYLKSWSAPFIMATINSKNIHRSNALLGHRYGKDFAYDEMMLTGDGEAGEKAAKFVANSNPLAGDDAPKPGEGPSKEERENGFYDVLFIAELDNGETSHYVVKGDKDPGYGSTSKMLSESALCLLQDMPNIQGGIFTPAAIMAEPLMARLSAHAGLSFALEKA